MPFTRPSKFPVEQLDSVAGSSNEVVSKVKGLAFGDMSRTFTGSDITALIIRRDDPVLLKRAAEYLAEVQKSLEAPLSSEENEVCNVIDFSSPVGQDIPYDKENVIPILTLQAITVSTFRTKRQVRALGHVNPRGVARGNRTVGGTLILTEFDRDAFWKLISIPDPVAGSDINIGDSGAAVLADQIAPFDILLMFANEAGLMSYRMIYEIDIVTNGSVYSIQDMYSENTLSFLCTDITPLTPLPSVVADIWRSAIDGSLRNYGTKGIISPMASITGGKEVLRRYRMLKRARTTER